MNDDRPLHVLASRVAHIFGLPLLDAQEKYPEDPRLRAFRFEGVVVDQAHKDTAPVWLEFGRGLTGGTSWEIVVRSYDRKIQRTLISERTPKAFRTAFSVMENAIDAARALDEFRMNK